jgi:hypothetical protein
MRKKVAWYLDINNNILIRGTYNRGKFTSDRSCYKDEYNKILINENDENLFFDFSEAAAAYNERSN